MSGDRERHILERAIHEIAERARDAYSPIEKLDAHGADLDGSITLAAKQLRMELTTKAPSSGSCPSGFFTLGAAIVGFTGSRALARIPGHWAHAEPGTRARAGAAMESGRIASVLHRMIRLGEPDHSG